MGLIEEGEGWFLTVAIRKIVVMGIKFLIGWLASETVQKALLHWGITIDTSVAQATLLAYSMMVVEAIHDWVALKIKNGGQNQ